MFETTSLTVQVVDEAKSLMGTTNTVDKAQIQTFRILINLWCSTFPIVVDCWHLSHSIFSHAEKERTACRVEQIHKMTTIFTQMVLGCRFEDGVGGIGGQGLSKVVLVEERLIEGILFQL